MDSRRFQSSHGWRVWKSVEDSDWRFRRVGEAPFLLVTFLWAPSKKSHSPTTKAFDVKDDDQRPLTRLRGTLDKLKS
jgi:hypothetical protein